MNEGIDYLAKQSIKKRKGSKRGKLTDVHDAKRCVTTGGLLSSPERLEVIYSYPGECTAELGYWKYYMLSNSLFF